MFPFDCHSAAVPGQNVCICATAIEQTDKVVRTLRRAEQEADAWAANGEPTQVSVGQAHVPRLKQCTYRTAKAAPCMCLRHADGDKQRDSTNFWSFVVSCSIAEAAEQFDLICRP